MKVCPQLAHRSRTSSHHREIRNFCAHCGHEITRLLGDSELLFWSFGDCCWLLHGGWIALRMALWNASATHMPTIITSFTPINASFAASHTNRPSPCESVFAVPESGFEPELQQMQ